jgi:acyl-coenzyme A synthetase/AMP-(fatty) acid ligase
MRAGMIMEFIGRKDNQVKIRGFRVELGEIENVLKQSPMVSQAVVLAPDDREGGRRLVGYIVPQGPLDRQALVGFLQQKLPDYMIPSAWMELERLPLTSNGKIDKKALPALEPSLPEAASDGAPESDVEKSLAQFWM